ncbi:hypothetical protein IAT38_002841 [Cryptococcus sp. DSM 104549]
MAAALPSQQPAASSGDSLLREVKRGTAAEAIMAVRYNSTPPGPTFVPSLDDAILERRPHPGGSSLQRGDLVELVGPSGSGKTSLLTFFLLTTLLPPSLPPPHHSIPLGGKGGHATLLQPITHRPLLPALRQAMRAHIRACAPILAEARVERVVEESLGRLTVGRVRPRWKELALALRGVLDGAEPSGVAEAPEGALDLLVVDGLGDGYYPYRWAEEERGKRQVGGEGQVVKADEVGMKHVMEGIGRVRKELGSVVVMSVQGLRTFREAHPFYLPHLPPPYPQPFASTSSTSNSNPTLPRSRSSPTHWPLNIQITLLGRSRGLQLPGDTTLVDALRSKVQAERDKAARGVDAGVRYEGVVRMVRMGDGAVVGTRSDGRFSFGIGNEGVQVWGES